MEDRKQKFYAIVKARSAENERALNSLLQGNCYALVGAIIRMELDSLVRVFDFSNSDPTKQEKILDDFFEGKKWSNYDRNMVNALSRKLGWAEHIYDFCCAFVHLSPYHDWASTDDIPNLTQDKRRQIVSAIKGQQDDVWGYDTTFVINEDFGFNDLLPFVPHIFKKLKSNLPYEMK